MCGIVGKVCLGKSVRLEDVLDLLINNHNRGHDSIGFTAKPRDVAGLLPPFKAFGSVREACTMSERSYRNFYESFESSEPLAAIGHGRYGTQGENSLSNAQPICFHGTRFGSFAIVHNGQVSQYKEWRDWLQQQGENFTTTSDSEVLAAFIAHSTAPTLFDAVIELVDKIGPAYSLLVLGEDCLIAARDRNGVWPLWMQVGDGEVSFSSELGALSSSRDSQRVLPGTICKVNFSDLSIERFQKILHPTCQQCCMDAIYMSAPDQGIGDDVATVEDLRWALGVKVAKLERLESTEDILFTYVGDSGQHSAEGLVWELGFRLHESLVRARGATNKRSFISPDQLTRQMIIRKKHRISRRKVFNKVVYVVDDTIVRSDTIAFLAEKLFEAGAKEVHVRIPAPPNRFTCHLGIDMATTDELIAHQYETEEEIAKAIGVTSLRYLPVEDFVETLEEFAHGWCLGCMTGEYPAIVPLEV